MRFVALIPARAGSKRVPGKNTRLLAGHPLLAYAIQAAWHSGVFASVYVSSEDEATLEIAQRYGAQTIKREDWMSTDDEPDIHWVRHALLRSLEANAFAILRPTSPFRTAATIKRAYVQFRNDEVHSLRAMEPVKQHPGKMWQIAYAGYPAMPLIGEQWPVQGPGWASLKAREDAPWHSQPTQTLPKVYVQNASLEIAWSYVVPAFGTISGRKVAPFLTTGYEGFDINTEDDWREAERLIATGAVTLPSLHAYHPQV